MAGPLRFVLDATRPETRHLRVALEFDTQTSDPGAPSIELFLPTWTPGSYLVREYSRHLSRVRALDAASGEPLPCAKSAKNRFTIAIAPSTRRVRVEYSVHAHELSVRTADLTAGHAYWNHACVLLWPVGQPNVGAEILVRKPAGWRLACSLPRRTADSRVLPWPTAATGSGATLQTAVEETLVAASLDEAVDAPCLVGTGAWLEFVVEGVPHGVVLDGLGGLTAPSSLPQDLSAIVRAAAGVFGGRLPYAHYLFLCLFTAEGHGGLEHGESTTLLVSRTALRTDKGYREFLSLAAHELFHAWNVKRLRPTEFWNYDYEHENYTELLWLIEGWTAYYDDLLCLRAGLTSVDEYLAVAARNITGMRSAPGRFRLSLAESSFDAWIRLYRPDANTKNSSQNYYGNGAVAAMCLDLQLRAATAGRSCLDDVLRSLYAATFAAGRGYRREDVFAAVASIGGPECVAALRAWTEGVLDPDLAILLAPFGLRLVPKDAGRPFLGLSFEAGKTTVATVQADTPAEASGIAPGDEILALAGLRVDSDRWGDVLQAVATVGQPIEVLLARRGVVAQLVITPSAGVGALTIERDPGAGAAAVSLRDAWLPNQRTAPPKLL